MLRGEWWVQLGEWRVSARRKALWERVRAVRMRPVEPNRSTPRSHASPVCWRKTLARVRERRIATPRRRVASQKKWKEAPTPANRVPHTPLPDGRCAVPVVRFRCFTQGDRRGVLLEHRRQRLGRKEGAMRSLRR